MLLCVCVRKEERKEGKEGRRESDGGGNLVQEDAEVGVQRWVDGGLKQWQKQVPQELAKVLQHILLLVDVTGIKKTKL